MRMQWVFAASTCRRSSSPIKCSPWPCGPQWLTVSSHHAGPVQPGGPVLVRQAAHDDRFRDRHTVAGITCRQKAFSKSCRARKGMARGIPRIEKPSRTCSNALKCFTNAVVVIHRVASYRQLGSCKTGFSLSEQRMRPHSPGPLDGEKTREPHME